MANKHGDFIWYELMAGDVEAAQDFYGAILGWKFQDSGQTDRDYRMFSANGEMVGGVMSLTDEMSENGMRPCWMSYIAVDDVDTAARAIADSGGTIHMEPWVIPDIGRAAFVADPQGVMFYIMKPTPPANNPDATSNAFAYDKPMVGHCAWNELATTDQDGAIAFYTSLFGWKQKDEMDMGPMGKYKFLHHGNKMVGAAMTKPDKMPKPVWSYYFRIPDIDEAVVTIKTNGGQVTLVPNEIPGGEFAMEGIDPQGAAFALVGARK